MKRPIKFRGRTCGNVMVYGDLRHVGSTAVIDDTAVYEDSIAQLVGFDRDGAEVYEGDIVEYTSSRPGDRASQRTKTAPIGLCPQIYADDTDHNKPMRRFKLKEA